MKNRDLFADTLCHIKLFHQETQADTKIVFNVEKRHFFAFIQNKKVIQFNFFNVLHSQILNFVLKVYLISLCVLWPLGNKPCLEFF